MAAQLVVMFMDDSVGYFSDFHCWKIENKNGVPQIVLKQGDTEGPTPGLPRTIIPLTNVRFYRVEKLGD